MIGFDVKKFIDETKNVMAAENRATMRALSKAAFEISKSAKESIERSEKASKPGTAPHTRRGQLKRAIRYSVEKADSYAVIGPLASMVGTSAEAHEFGGKYKGEQYPERPFMGPALEKNLIKVPAFWSAEIHN